MYAPLTRKTIVQLVMQAYKTEMMKADERHNGENNTLRL